MIEDFLPIIYLFMFIGLGLLGKIVFRGRDIYNRFVKYLSSFLYYVLIPVVFFNVFMKRGLEVADTGIFIIATIYVVVSVSSLLIFTRRMKRETRNALVITSTFQNAIFLGFPVILILYGNLQVAAMYSLVLFIYHIVVAGLLATGSSKIAKQVLRIPLLYGFTAGIIAHIVMDEELITSLSRILDPAGPLLSYSATFVLGATIPLKLNPVLQRRFEVVLIGIWRFLVSPAIHYAVLIITGLSWSIGEQILILSVMPPAVMNTVLARIYDWDPELVAGATMIHTFISLGLILAIIFL